MPSTIGKCKLFKIKHTTLSEGETFLRNKHDIAFFEIKCTFVDRKENTIRLSIARRGFPTLTENARKRITTFIILWTCATITTIGQ